MDVIERKTVSAIGLLGEKCDLRIDVNAQQKTCTEYGAPFAHGFNMEYILTYRNIQLGVIF